MWKGNHHTRKEAENVQFKPKSWAWPLGRKLTRVIRLMKEKWAFMCNCSEFNSSFMLQNVVLLAWLCFYVDVYELTGLSWRNLQAGRVLL